jgi:hypothetical protein
VKESLLAELEAARLTFHALLDSLSDQDLKQPSANPAWTNQQILFHMAFGYFLIPSLIAIVLIFGRLPDVFSETFAALLNAVTRPFNAINALGPQGGGRILGRQALSATFDTVYALIVGLLRLLPESELRRGMHYPTRWDSLFRDYMTMAEIFRFPMVHFYFHLSQIRRSSA